MDFISLVNAHYEDLNLQEKKIVAYLQQLETPPKELTSQRLADAFLFHVQYFSIVKKIKS